MNREVEINPKEFKGLKAPPIPPDLIVYPDFIFSYDAGVAFLKLAGWTDEEINEEMNKDGLVIKRKGGGSITIYPQRT